MPKKKVTLYTGNDHFSTMARNYLAKKNVDFEEIDATKPEGIEKLVKKTRQTRLPFLIVKASRRVSTSSSFDEFLYASALDPKLSYNEFLNLKQKEHEVEK